MLKTVARLEYKFSKELDNGVSINKDIHLTCDHDTPIEAIKEALFQYLKYIGKIEDDAKANVEAQKIEEDQKKCEENKQVEECATGVCF